MHLRISVPKGIMKSKVIKYVVIVILFALCGGYYYIRQSPAEGWKIPSESVECELEDDLTEPTDGVTDTPRDEGQKIIVHVCGAVATPGVYELREDARVYEAISLAGGVTKDAAGERLNQALQLTDGQQLYVANVGDSSLYVIGNTIKQITKDHSLVNEMVRMGEIDESEARMHPDKNIITRAIGAAEHIEVDFFEVELCSDDVILLCSDGLTNMVSDGEIFDIIKKN